MSLNKINRRKRLLKLDLLRQSNLHFLEIKTLSNDIKSYYRSYKINKVKNTALSNGNVNNLWKAIKIAKNLSCDTIPSNLTHDGVPVDNVANAFA